MSLLSHFTCLPPSLHLCAFASIHYPPTHNYQYALPLQCHSPPCSLLPLHPQKRRGLSGRGPVTPRYRLPRPSPPSSQARLPSSVAALQTTQASSRFRKPHARHHSHPSVTCRPFRRDQVPGALRPASTPSQSLYLPTPSCSPSLCFTRS